ncbi:two-component response regulator [Mariprofundus micogutta]|uniref:Two-component response regulator n=1 Tax=Mariprofundus micogutta TaxID=1921010 RepID=A0A1L8CJU7_9PROT|nr:response regulator [Mariprofundus micogutta]GAV19139.1 two-component response regulator [Mariprofundus micogutta]
MKKAPALLLIGDLGKVQDSMQQSLGFEILNTGDGQQCIDKFALRESDIVLVIADLHQGKNGIDAAKDIRDDNADVPVLFMTDMQERQAVQQIGEFSNYYLLTKPYSVVFLRDCIRSVLRR